MSLEDVIANESNVSLTLRLPLYQYNKLRVLILEGCLYSLSYLFPVFTFLLPAPPSPAFLLLYLYSICYLCFISVPFLLFTLFPLSYRVGVTAMLHVSTDSISDSNFSLFTEHYRRFPLSVQISRTSPESDHKRLLESLPNHHSWPFHSVPQACTQAVTIPTCIREMVGSNLGWDIHFPNGGFPWCTPASNCATDGSFHVASNLVWLALLTSLKRDAHASLLFAFGSISSFQ